MAKFILGKKLEMTQKFLADGTVVPVTKVQAGPCTITQVKGEADGYQAVQLGFGKRRLLSKPLAGHLRGLSNFRYLREFRIAEGKDFARGKVVDVTSFNIGDLVQVSGVSKGRGFQGVVRRHHFHGSPATHGHKDQLRMPGSIGSGGVQRVFKGTRMAGHMGVDRVTVKNLEIVELDLDHNILYIKGAVPGARNGLVEIYGVGEIILKDVSAGRVESIQTEPVASAVATPASEAEVSTPTADESSNVAVKTDEEVK